MSKRGLFGIATALGAVLLLGGGTVAAQTGALFPTTPTYETVSQMGSWRVDYVRVAGDSKRPGQTSGAGVAYDSTQRDGILKYAESVRQVGRRAFDGQTTVPALVTFRHPIPPNRFSELMQQSSAKVKSYRIRTVRPNGERGTLTGAPESDGTIFDPQHAARLLRDRPDTVQGMVDAEIIINVRGYDSLSLAATEVFLVDTLRVAAQAELVKKGRNDVPVEKIYLIPPYWALEKFGLTN